MKAPNIVFISTDQQTWDALGASGNPWVSTPHMNRIVSEGVSFSRSYCSDPVCSPARSSWVTGLFPSETGVFFNDSPAHPSISDIGFHLSSHGYNAFHSGKWHIPGTEAARGFRVLYDGKIPIGACGAEVYDAIITRSVLDFLANYDEREPFFLQVNYINPHDICEYEHNWEQRDLPNPISLGILEERELPPLPANFAYDTNETLVQRVFRRGVNPVIHPKIQNAIGEWDEIQWRYLIWTLYRLVERVDSEIGRVLNALETTRFSENTIIIFSVDHGEAHGRHKTFQKFSLYEESIRVPFVVSTLGDGIGIQKGHVDTEHFVSGVDLVPTVCDYASIPFPEGIQGKSVRPLVEGRNVSDWRDFAFVESNFFARAIIQGDYKYIMEYVPEGIGHYEPPGPEHSQTGLDQLFNLKEDPWETHSLSADPNHRTTRTALLTSLQNFERGLRRRPASHDRSRKIIDEWSMRILRSASAIS